MSHNSATKMRAMVMALDALIAQCDAEEHCYAGRAVKKLKEARRAFRDAALGNKKKKKLQ